MRSVALIGPDGAGKTTISRMLQQSSSLPFKYLYMGINIEASNAAFPTSYLGNVLKQSTTRSWVLTQVQKSHYPKRLGKLVWNSARLLNRLLDEWYRQLLAWTYELRGYIVLYDRHFRLDFSRNVPNESFNERLHRTLVSRFYPSPDLVIYLDAPPEILYARKREKDLTDLAARRQDYLRLSKQMKHFVLIDATQPLEIVYESIHRLIAEQYDRHSRRTFL